jgi:DNA-binding NtrC family response regulator
LEVLHALRKLISMSKRILSISYDRALLWTRQLLLEQLGYKVISAEGFAQAWEAAENKKDRFDLIILGHSIPPNDKKAIVAHLRDSCDCPILALLRPYEAPVSEAAVSIDAGDPSAFLNAVRKMLDRN